MEPRTDFLTPEWIVTVVVNIAMAVVAILAARGLVTPEEGQLWVALIQAFIVGIAPVVMGVVTKAYLDGRTQVKTTLINRSQ